MLLVCLIGFVIHMHNASTDVSSGTADGSEAVLDAENGETAAESEPEGPEATLLFASDYQHEEGWDEPEENLSALIDTAEADGKTITGVIMCGDYSNEYKQYNHQISPESAIETISELCMEKCPETEEDDILFVQGNHDALTESISESGLHEYDDYLVYVLNTQNDFPWCQGKTSGCLKKVTRAAAEMKECFDDLIESGETRPVIIAGHVPLHFTARTSSRHSTGDNLYSSLIFDVVNEAADSLDIIYLFGHNHSKGWDCYMGGGSIYREAGDTILIPEFTETDVNTDEYSEETLDFTYLNAGYVGYYMNCSEDDLWSGNKEQYDAADMELTATVCDIYEDKIVLTRYDDEGIHALSAQGCADPYKNYIDKELIPENYYGKPEESPQTIVLKNAG